MIELLLAQQNAQNLIGLHMGGDTDARGHEAATGRGTGFEIADNIDVPAHFADPDGVAGAVASEAGSGDDRFALERLQQHGLLVGTIERLDHHIDFSEKFRNVFGRDAHAMGFVLHIGVDAIEIGFKRFGLRLSQLVDEILLAIEVAGFDDVEVGKDQFADTDAGQRYRNRRTQAAESGNADG